MAPTSSSSSPFLLFFLLFLAYSSSYVVSAGSASEDAGSNLGFRSEAAQVRFQEYDDTYDYAEDGEERFLFSSTSAVPVNSTLLRAIGAIIGALLIALPLYLAYATATGGGGGGGGGGSGGGYGGSHYARKRRFRRGEDEGMSYS